MIRATIAIVVMLAVVFLAWRAQERNKDTASLDGEWKLTSITKDGGREFKDSPLTAHIAANKFTMRWGERQNTATFTTDASVTPATIDMTRDSDGEDAMPGKGIWKLGKNTLTMCFVIGEGERPKDFKPAEGNVVMVFERVEK